MSCGDKRGSGRVTPAGKNSFDAVRWESVIGPIIATAGALNTSRPSGSRPGRRSTSKFAGYIIIIIDPGVASVRQSAGKSYKIKRIRRRRANSPQERELSVSFVARQRTASATIA